MTVIDVASGVEHEVGFRRGGSWQVRDFIYIKLDIGLGIGRSVGGAIDDWELVRWGGEHLDFDASVDLAIKDGDVLLIDRRRPVDDGPKVCPSSDPQISRHNWGMWRPYDPMIAGSEVTRHASYFSSCDNLGCQASRRAKGVVAVGVTLDELTDVDVDDADPT